MGAQWKHAGRVSNAAKKGAVVGKLVKELIVAAKMGGPDPDGNSRLRAALESARKQSVPRDTIERAIKKGAGLLDEPVTYETIVYEGFAPHQIPVIVECLTDNKNRTASDIRSLFRKAQLGSIGSVAWMFDRLGVVEGTHVEPPNSKIDLEEVAIEANAQNFEALEAENVPAGSVGIRCFCAPTDLDVVSKYLTQNGWAVTQAEMSYIAKTPVEVTDAAKKKEITDFLESIDDHDDVHRIYAALK